MPGKYVIDTPFVTKRNVNGITTSEVMGIVQRLTGMRGGELRFFFGRKAADLAKHRLLRYFYFLDGDVNDYPKPEVEGEWVDFETVKKIYSRHKDSMALTLLTDISRMVTVVLTQKLFDEHGYRKMKVKSYRPNVTLPEIREANYDFQDDKWIRISMYNSDIRSFKFKRFWTKMLNLIAPERKNKNEEWQDDL